MPAKPAPPVGAGHPRDTCRARDPVGAGHAREHALLRSRRATALC
jgi:hypothetical protein